MAKIYLTKAEIDDKYLSGKSFPSEKQDPEIKHDMKYCVDVAEAIYSLLLVGRTGIPITMASEFDENRLYGNTQQPVSLYQQRYSTNADKKDVTGQYDISEINNDRNVKREGYMNVFWKKIHVADKIKDWFHGQFDDAEFDINARAIDQKSGAEREQMEVLFNIWKDYGAKMEEFTNIAQLPSMKGMFVPDTEEEELLFTNSQGFKLVHEKLIEELTQHTLDISDYADMIKIKWIDDMLEVGIIAGKQYFDFNDNKLKWAYVDPNPACFGIQSSKHFDYKDSEFAYELVWEKVSSLRGKICPEDPEKEYEMLSVNMQQFCGLYNNPPSWDYYTKDSQRYGFFDDFRVPVLHCSWLDTDSERKLIFHTIYGAPSRNLTIRYDEKITGRRLHDMKQKNEKKGIETYVDRPRLYQSSWIIGTRIAYNYGLANYQSFPPKLPYSVIKITTNPIIKRIIPQIDQINLAWFKFQNALTQMRLNGVSLNMKALEQVTMGGGNILDPLDLFERFIQTGTLIHNPVEWDGTPGTSQKPFEDIPGGMGNILNEIIAVTNDAYARIERETGISQVMMGMTPAPRTPGKVTESAVKNSMNITKPIISNIMRLKSDMAEKTCNSLPPLFKTCPEAVKAYGMVIGNNGVEIMKKASKYANYGIKLEPRPTDTEWAILDNLIAESIKTGDLRIDSAAKIYQMKANGYTYKQINILFQKEIAKNDERKAAQQQAQMQQQQQMMAQNAQMKQQMAQSEAQSEAAVNNQIIQGKLAQEDKRADHKANLKVLEKQLGN